MNIYRFKIEQEFVKELGSNWRDDIKYGWHFNMDYLLNKTLPIKYNYLIDKYDKYDGWKISQDMLIFIKPSYKPRNFLIKNE